MSERRSYDIDITINERKITEVVIDSHYEEDHADTISDGLILNLVKLLDSRTFLPDDVDGEFEYFKTDPLTFKGKNYRLVWLLKEQCMFIGVVNAFRRN